MMPTDALGLPTLQLMKKRDIPALLNRLVTSDLYIHTLCPHWFSIGRKRRRTLRPRLISKLKLSLVEKPVLLSLLVLSSVCPVPLLP